MAWLTAIDVRSRRLPWFLRAVYFFLKWMLVAFGAWLLIGLYLERWGISATVWLLGAPAVYGLIRGLSRRLPTD